MPPRQEYRSRYSVSFGGPLTAAVKALLIINVAIYILELFLLRLGGQDAWEAALSLFALNPVLAFGRFYLWQLVTYMFMHSPYGIGHILLNMLILWMFGGDVERLWGTKRFVRYYLICGVGAALANCAFGFLQSRTVGASGAIFGLIVAYGMLFPARTILFWGIFPMTARQLAILLAAIELVSLGAFSSEGVARFAHLGGALTGYLLIKRAWDPRRFIHDLRWRLRRRRFRRIERDESGRPGRSGDDRSYPFH